MTLMAIDPGLNSMGWAFWETTTVVSIRNRVRPPDAVGLNHAPQKYDLVRRALHQAVALHHVVLDHGIEIDSVHFVSEYPAWHGDQVRKGWASGDMQKVCLLVGTFVGYLHQAKSFTLVTPNEWKGQMPKDVVKRRLIKRFGPGTTQDWERDVWDAVGIGLWKMGHF